MATHGKPRFHTVLPGLLSVYAYLLYCGYCCTAVLASPEEDIATTLFEHWKQLAPDMPHGEAVQTAMDKTDKQLQKLAHDYGFSYAQVWRWHAHNHSLSYMQHIISGTKDYLGQTVAYHDFINISVFSNPAYANQFPRDFAFYFELADAFLVHPNTSLLQLPILVNSRGPSVELYDSYSLPVVDLYMGCGLYKYMLSPEQRRAVTFHGDAWRIFSFDMTYPDWEEKRAEVVYRGAGRMTANPLHFYDGSIYKTLGLRQTMDQYAKDRGIPNVCCLTCGDKGSCDELKLDEMLQYRYQLNIDGWSACWEAAFWKYSSGSVVIYVLPTNTTTGDYWQPWSLWWYPILKPGVHYIETTVENSKKTIEDVMARPDGGQSLAEASAAMMRKGANPKVATHYMYLVMKHMHDAAHESSGD